MHSRFSNPEDPGPFRVLCALVVLVLGTDARQREARLPGDGFERLTPELRAHLRERAPVSSSWEGEKRAAQVIERLNELRSLASGAAFTSPGAAFPEAFVIEHLTIRTPVRASTETSGSLAPFRIERPSSELEETQGPAASLMLAALLHESTDYHVTGVRGEGEIFVTEIHNRGDYPIWEASWRFTEAGPRLEFLDLRTRLVAKTTVSEPLFRDGTSDVFRNEGSLFQRRLAPGISDWRARLDTRLGQPLLGHAAGIALGDVDGDGREDVYLCQPGGLPNLLLLHQSDGSVRDVSRESGVDYLDFSRAVLLLDFDGDGHEDLVTSVVDSIVFHRGGGNGTFERKALVAVPSSTSLAAADYDLDGDLDVYVCAYADPYAGAHKGGALPRPYHDANNGQRNVLVRNEGEWTLADATTAEGLDRINRRFSFAAAWEDYDRDGDPDLYVANDFGRNNLYRNEHMDSGFGGTGGFLDVAARAGVEDLAAGMGVSFGDVDGDGWSDLYVSNMYSAAGNRVAYGRRFQSEAPEKVRAQFQRHAQGNSLFLNDRKGGFVAAKNAGVQEAGWAWGARFFDLNNDGRLDILSPNGLLTQERPDDL